MLKYYVELCTSPITSLVTVKSLDYNAHSSTIYTAILTASCE